LQRQQRGKGKGGFNVKVNCTGCEREMSPANLGKHKPQLQRSFTQCNSLFGCLIQQRRTHHGEPLEVRTFGTTADKAIESAANVMQCRLRSELHRVYFDKVKQGSIGDRRNYKVFGCEQYVAGTGDYLCLDEVIRRTALLLARDIRIKTLGTELVTKCPPRIPPGAPFNGWFIEVTRSGNNDLPNMKVAFRVNERGFSLRTELLVQGVQ
jgi:hypothetical protein